VPQGQPPGIARLALLALALLLLLLAGTVGYAVTEHASLGFGFVWSLDTVATIGSIPEPASSAGQIVKVTLIVLGVGTLFYALVTAVEFFVAGHLSGLLDQRRALKQIDSLNDHVLVCGFGRVGRQVARDLREAGRDFVVIDTDVEGTSEHAELTGAPIVHGRASDDEVLRQAGIMRADGLIACVDSDAENVFITLSARELRADIAIVARASEEDSERKMLRAGADRVVSPYKQSGSEMVRLALGADGNGTAGAVEV